MAQSSHKPSLAEALKAAQDTRALEIGRNVLHQTPDVFRQQFGPRPAVVVADANTFAAAGRVVFDAFRRVGHLCREPFIYSDPNLYAEHGYVAQLEDSLKAHNAIPVAVGAGTINDITKFAAHRADRPYLCVATAASMDGYTAFGASITHEGSKQTFHCPAPAAVVADLDVIRAAPGDMNAWGYADLLAKVTAGADWLLAYALGVEPIHPQAWCIAQGRLRELVADPEGVRARRPEAIERLVEGLMLGGFAMQAARSSRAASGAEHQFSHLWDMVHHTYQGRTTPHGLKVGIGTLAVTALYEFILTKPLEDLDVEVCCAQWPDQASRKEMLQKLFDDPVLARVARMETNAKSVDGAALRAQLENLRNLWPELRERLRQQLLPLAQLKAMLQAAGAPVEPEQIGISRPRLRQSFWQASFIRRRFTVLDLVLRAGMLDRALEHLFGSEGPWPIAAAVASERPEPARR
jgi:glycerol-1-phosphate dehydrogenase [NAD(P)+]